MSLGHLEAVEGLAKPRSFGVEGDGSPMIAIELVQKGEKWQENMAGNSGNHGFYNWSGASGIVRTISNTNGAIESA